MISVSTRKDSSETIPELSFSVYGFSLPARRAAARSCGPLRLLHRHALGQVPGLINVAAMAPRGRPRGGPFLLYFLGRNESALRNGPGRPLLACGQFTLRFSPPAKTLGRAFRRGARLPAPAAPFVYSTVTLLARFRGLSMSQPRMRAT